MTAVQIHSYLFFFLFSIIRKFKVSVGVNQVVATVVV